MDGLIASWDGESLHVWGGDSESPVSMHLSGQADGEEGSPGPIPELDAATLNAPLTALLLPVEQLLVRPFTLPLSHPRFLDAAVLGEELAELSGEDAGQWWLSWETAVFADGIAGIVIGLREDLRRMLANHPLWSKCIYIGADAAVRLNGWLPEDESSYGIIDADEDGVFFGVIADGVWMGIRRLNLSAQSAEDLIDNMVRSFEAMDFDAERMGLYGRIPESWKAMVEARLGTWQGESEAHLPSRHEANGSAAAVAGVPLFNFRHDGWAVQGDASKVLRPWRRVAVLFGIWILSLLATDIHTLYQLRERNEALRQGIEQAFHRGLPNEKVMLDPLAQLRAAVGGNGGGIGDFIRQLESIGHLKKQIAGLQVREVHYGPGATRLVGIANDLGMVNRIRNSLTDELEHAVELEDTEIDGKRVRFRMKWS